MIELHASGYHVRSEHLAADLAAVHEVVLSDAYRLKELASLWTRSAPLHVIDVGAHIGTFSRMFHLEGCRRNVPHAAIAIEANPDNLEVLRANVAEWGHVVHGACYYGGGELSLYNTIHPAGSTTCTSSSTVAIDGAALKPDYADPHHAWHWHDSRPLPRVTLEQVMGERGWDRIDLLKLDCEGAEFSILENCDLSRVHMIVGEWHDRARFDALLRERLFDWRLRRLGEGKNSGIFWLSR